MAAVTLVPRSQAHADLSLLGLRLIASAEDCDCPMCRHLDSDYDVDLLAAMASDGRPVLVSYRHQPIYEYQTLTLRSLTSNGNPSQVRRLLRQRSLAHRYVHSYRRWVMHVSTEDLLRALGQPPLLPCLEHSHVGPAGTTGLDGQRFLAVCQACCPGLRVVYRPEAAP